MADKKIFIDDSPENPDVKLSPFDLTYTSNITGKFGQVQCCLMKYLPPKTRISLKPFFAFDMMPLVYPIQTNVRCHIKLYSVPLRILWKDAEDYFSMIGQNGTPVNSGARPFVRPYIKRAPGWNPLGSLAEQIGCSNIKYTGAAAVESIACSNSKVFFDSEGNIYSLPTTSVSSSERCVFFQIPRNGYLDKVSSNGWDNFHFRLACIDTVSSTPSNTSGDITIHLCVKKQINVGSNPTPYGEETEFAEGFQVVKSSVISNSVSTQAAFNSASVSTYQFDGVSRVNTSQDEISFYEHRCYVKIFDDAFLNECSLRVAQGYECAYIVTFTGDLKSRFFPPAYRNINEIKISQLTTIRPTKYSESTGDITSQNILNLINSNVGCAGNVFAGVFRVSRTTHNLFDSVNGGEPVEPISALPFRALEFIHNYFFRNKRIDPFLKDGVPTFNKFLTNDQSGADTTTPVDSWLAYWEDDYFTTCVKEPQFGNAPLVGVTVNDMSDTGILKFSDGTGYNEYTVGIPIGADGQVPTDGQVMPLTMYKEDANRPNVHRLQELIKFGISVNDLRNVGTFQRMLERMERSVLGQGSAFKNVMYEFFGTNPPIGDHFPRYIGGVTRNMMVDKITNVAESEDAPLGKFAGNGKFRGEGENITLFTNEPTYLVGIQYFTVTPCYPQYLPKHLIYKDPLDFYLNPEFAYVGPQPVYKKEIAAGQMDAARLNEVFGYNRPYAELFSNVDEVHGQFRDDMANFVLQRLFADAPELNKSFIEINPNDLLNIFSVVENTDKIYGQVLFKIHGELPAPRSYVARSI